MSRRGTIRRALADLVGAAAVAVAFVALLFIGYGFGG